MVPDVDEAIAGIEAAGGKTRRAGEDRPEHAVRAAVVTDPEGHVLELVGPMKQVGNALCNAVVTGDVAAVKAAIDAGAATAADSGEVVSAHIIARPDEAINDVLPKAAAPRAARK